MVAGCTPNSWKEGRLSVTDNILRPQHILHDTLLTYKFASNEDLAYNGFRSGFTRLRITVILPKRNLVFGINKRNQSNSLYISSFTKSKFESPLSSIGSQEKSVRELWKLRLVHVSLCNPVRVHRCVDDILKLKTYIYFHCVRRLGNTTNISFHGHSYQKNNIADLVLSDLSGMLEPSYLSTSVISTLSLIISRARYSLPF